MKILEKSIKTILLLAISLLTAQLHAQEYRITSQQEGSNKSSYTIKAGNDQAKVELTNSGNNIFLYKSGP